MSQKNMEVMLNMEDKAEAEELTTFLKSVNITRVNHIRSDKGESCRRKSEQFDYTNSKFN